VGSNTIENLSVGMVSRKSYLFSPERVYNFANLVDDMAPVHFNSEFAKLQGFQDRVVHGLFVQSIISGMLGNEMPGPNSVINNLSMKMHLPTLIGQTVNYSIEITSITHAVGAVSLSVLGTVNQEVVISGKVLCSFPLHNRN